MSERTVVSAIGIAVSAGLAVLSLLLGAQSARIASLEAQVLDLRTEIRALNGRLDRFFLRDQAAAWPPEKTSPWSAR